MTVEEQLKDIVTSTGQPVPSPEALQALTNTVETSYVDAVLKGSK